MGYSARYHATSLIAVFLALAVGILIGAEFGGDALTETRKNLEQSLVGNLQDARSHADDLSSELGHVNEFDEKVYPVLTRDRLLGKRIAVIAMGGLPGEITSGGESALAPSGATIANEGQRFVRDLDAVRSDLMASAHPVARWRARLLPASLWSSSEQAVGPDRLLADTGRGSR